MNVRRYILAVAGVFAFVLGFDMIFHGQILLGLYEQTASLWRPESDHNMAFMIAEWVVFSAVVVFIFSNKPGDNKGVKEGAFFGLMIGLLIGSIQIGTYCYMPIPMALTVGWVVGSVFKGIGAGVVASLLYKK